MSYITHLFTVGLINNIYKYNNIMHLLYFNKQVVNKQAVNKRVVNKRISKTNITAFGTEYSK